MYWCRIPDHSWSRTVFHDERHWRILTSHRYSMACREYTLPIDENLSESQDWIRRNTKIGPVLEVTTCCLQSKYGVEVRIESNKDRSHSWVRISHGLNKLVTNLNNNEQETSVMQFEDYALKSNARAFASGSKAKAKRQRRISASSSTKTFLIGERTWTDIEPEDYSHIDYSVSKKLINLLRHGCLPEEDDGAIEFWRIKDYLQKHFLYCHHWSDGKWKSSMAGGGGSKKRFQHCTDPSGEEILYFRDLQSHSGRNLIDPSLQDSVVIPDDFFKYIYHVGCAINLHSIIHSGLIPGGKILSKRQTVFFLPMNPIDKKNTKILRRSTWKHRVLHGTCIKRGRTIEPRCIWVDIKFAQRKGFKVQSNTIERHHPLQYPESCSDGNWRNHVRKRVWINSTTSEDFLEKWKNEGIGFKSCWTWWKLPTNPTKDNKSNC